jgi:peptidoglycan/xylan/chitin deacetylase (PgdA/CDA1 family)
MIMIKTIRIVWILIALLVVQTGFSQTVDSLYQIGRWHGFRGAAITFTFDDGSPNQYSKAIPLFNEFDFNLTLFIVTGSSWGWPANWSALQQAAAEGHEIASHTVTHTSFADINDSLETVELRDSQKEINAHITGQKCITVAYPYCATGNRSICEQYYSAARICSGVIEPSTPRDFMAISSIICGPEGSVRTSENFISRASSAISSKGWCVYLLHGVDNDGGWSSVTSEILRETLQYLSDNRNDFWVGTFGNVVRYIKERNAASVRELSIQDSSITVEVTDTLDNEIFNYPISIRRALPQDWASVTATQNGQPVDAMIVVDNDILYIQFDAIPNNGEIVIARGGPTLIKSRRTGYVPKSSLMQNYPNPFNPETTIEYAVPSTEHVSITLYNLRGELVKTLVNQKQSAGTYKVTLPGADLTSRVYLYNLRAGSFNETKRLVLIK